jgi:crotonobetainyl-CoA:carnitine CoA-transferase CaiB-like acyl-CoA transferase
VSQPLEGTRVVDLSGLAGSYGTRLLAALGADVVKVEPPGGSPLRRLAPFIDGAPEPESSLWWAYLAMGTRSVVLDVGEPAGQERLGGLLAAADVVVEDHPPGLMEEEGIGFDVVAETNPDVVWVSITPFGLTGPKRHWTTSNLAAWAASGVLYTTGFPDQPPAVPGGPAQLAMHAAAVNGAIGTVLGLRARRLHGHGQRIDLSIQEAALVLSPEQGVPVFLDDRVHRTRSGNRRTLSRPFGLYPCSDGHISMLVLMPRHWDSLSGWIAEVTGNDAVTDPVWNDVVLRAETAELIDGWTEELTTSMTRLEFFREAQARGIPVTPVNTIEALRTDPHLDAVDFWDETDLPAGGSVAIPGAPFRTNAGWWRTARAPRLGEHTDEVLAV